MNVNKNGIRTILWKSCEHVTDFTIGAYLINLKHPCKLSGEHKIFGYFSAVFLVKNTNANPFHHNNSNNRSNSPEKEHKNGKCKLSSWNSCFLWFRLPFPYYCWQCHNGDHYQYSKDIATSTSAQLSKHIETQINSCDTHKRKIKCHTGDEAYNGKNSIVFLFTVEPLLRIRDRNTRFPILSLSPLRLSLPWLVSQQWFSILLL